MKKLKSAMLLVLAAFIWGAAFSAQSVGMEYIGPFTFNGIRFIIGGIVLLPVIAVLKRFKPDSAAKTDILKSLIPRGAACGAILAVAASLQQIGIIYTSPGKAGFITALYVILVPIFGLFLGKRSSALLFVSSALAVVGMFFLCISGEAGINRGDFLVFLCAIAFTFHILVIDRLAPDVDGVSLSCVQFFTAGILCSAVALFTEEINFASIIDAAFPLLYTGVLSSGVAYTLQIVGQKKTPPVLASLLLSLESVFSVITAWLFLNDTLSGREIAGCIIVFAAIVLAQLPIGQKK